MGESKIFESGGFVVTTERFVYGSNVVHLDDINGGAVPFVDRGWMGMFTIAGVGLAMLVWGGAVWKFIGFLCLPGAYFFFKYTVERLLIMSLKSGEPLRIQVGTTELLRNLADAVNNGIRGLNRARSNALRDDLAGLPSE